MRQRHYYNNDIKLPDSTYGGISIGDIITGYQAGYHRVTGFHETPGIAGIQVDFVTVLTSTGQLARRHYKCCHMDYCIKVDKDIAYSQYINDINEANTKYNAICNLLDKKDNTDEN